MNYYKVRFYQDHKYEVYYQTEYCGDILEESCFVGSISDCEAWIRLKEGDRI